MIKVGIIGGAGYTAGELIRILINHPDVQLVFVNSSSNAGNKLTDVHEGLYGETDMVFTDALPLDEIDVLFFCTAHGDTRKFLESHNVPSELKLIDLSTDCPNSTAVPSVRASMWPIRVVSLPASNWDCCRLPST